MSDIYQCIWDADQNGNGIQALLDDQAGDLERGFAKVSTKLRLEDENIRVIQEVKIPEAKKRTYHLALKLFDNFALRERDQEVDTAQERTEVHDFVEAIIDTPPMQVAREYVAQQTGSSVSRQRWYNTLMEMWFRKYSMGGDPDLSGFEHVVIGEQDGPKAKGYHFWYKYYLDDGFARQQDGVYDSSFPELTDDRIDYAGTKMANGQYQYPETVTISYRWFAPDYEREALRPLFKKIGGFFVGCSIEGLLALGTVRGHLGTNAPRKAVINGAEYDMKLYHSDNRRHIRTFYPVFLRSISPPIFAPPIDKPVIITDPPVEEGPTQPTVQLGAIRIIAALVNPAGPDQGLETVTLINLSGEKLVLNNWQIADRNDNRSSFSVEIDKGDTYRYRLDGRGAQLVNGDGMIKLLNENGDLVHLISYSRDQVREQGKTLTF